MNTRTSDHYKDAHKLLFEKKDYVGALRKKDLIAFLETADRTHETLEEFNRRLSLIKIDKEQVKDDLFDLLLRQYNDIHYEVGRMLYDLRMKITGESPSATLAVILQQDGFRPLYIASLRHALATLDSRKSMLLSLCDKPGMPDFYKEHCDQLLSSKEILERNREFYDQMDSQLLASAEYGDIDRFKQAILNGANVNQWNGWKVPLHGWGQAIHIMVSERGKHKSPTDVIQLFHYLLKSGNKLAKENGIIADKDSYWMQGKTAIQGILNFAYFDLALLYCASGSDIPDCHELNLPFVNDWQRFVQSQLVKEMNKEDGMLNKKALRLAYEFYNTVEAGGNPPSEHINQDCLLWLVATLGDLKPLQVLKQFNADANKPLSATNFTPFMMSVHCGNENVVQFLLQHGAKIDPKSVKFEDDEVYDSNTPNLLALALKRDYWSIGQKLIEAGVQPTEEQQLELNINKFKINHHEAQYIMFHKEPNRFEDERVKPLESQVADQQKEIETLQKKLEEEKTTHQVNVAKLDLKIDELNKKVKTPKQLFDEELLRAASEGRIEAIDGLMKLFNANIKTCNEKGETALHLCLAHQDMAIAIATAEFLLTKDQALFTMSAEGYMPIQRIAITGQIDLLDWLYAKGKLTEDQEVFDKVYAVATQEAKVFLVNRKLIEAAKTQMKTEENTEIAEGNIEGVRDALKKGADINVKAIDGETALYKAVYNKYMGVTLLLLEQGADPTIRMHSYNTTVLDLVKKSKHSRDKEYTALLATPFLWSAAQHGVAADVSTALEAGADLIGKDQEGKTALHKAVLTGNKETIKLLLKKHAEAKCDIRILDKHGCAPLDYLSDDVVIIRKSGIKVSLSSYVFEKFGSYKKEVKLIEKKLKEQEQVKLSGSSLSFVAAIGQSEQLTAEVSANVNQQASPNAGQEDPIDLKVEKKFG